MPWESVWREPKRNPSLPVSVEFPAGAAEFYLGFGIREAFRGEESYHYCEHCGGWIPGMANDYPVNTLGMLSGRRGREYYCARCGEEIAFVGVLS